jgi:hypothetical protein
MVIWLGYARDIATLPDYYENQWCIHHGSKESVCLPFYGFLSPFFYLPLRQSGKTKSPPWGWGVGVNSPKGWVKLLRIYHLLKILRLASSDWLTNLSRKYLHLSDSGSVSRRPKASSRSRHTAAVYYGIWVGL